MWRNKQYDAENDGNISLQTADTLQRRTANDASCAPNLPVHTALCFSWKWNVQYLKCLLNIQEPRILSQMKNNIHVDSSCKVKDVPVS